MMSHIQMRATPPPFAAFEPPDEHAGPKFSLCFGTWGFISYFIVYGSSRGHETSCRVIYVGQGAIMLFIHCKSMLKCQIM